MNTYVALLRGINVGGNNKIEMTKLKTSFEKLGHQHVTTYINSGNVIFTTRKSNIERIATEIENVIRCDFGLNIPVVIRDQQNIEKICKKIPVNWTNDAEHKTDIMFLWSEYVSRSTLRLIDTNPAVDTLLYVNGAIVWHLKKENYSKSKLNDLIGTKLYKNMTVRNVNTVRKLCELMD